MRLTHPNRWPATVFFSSRISPYHLRNCRHENAPRYRLRNILPGTPDFRPEYTAQICLKAFSRLTCRGAHER